MTTKTPIQTAGALAAEENKLLACIHCGLCLEACPTYVHTGDENDSPRGRIYLMRAVEEQRLSVESSSFERHINRCLGCRACESACPAGVEYGQLLEAARADLATQAGARRRGFSNRLLHFALRHIWLHPARLRFAFALSRVLRDAGVVRLLLRTRLPRLVSSRLEFALALLQSSTPYKFETETQSSRPAPCDTKNDGRLAVKTRALAFEGCVTEGLFARVNRATARVLKANNCETSAPASQVCCGALHAHAGDLEGARKLARRNIEAFADTDGAHIITNAGGCGAMLLSYAHLLADDAQFAERARAFSERVRDVGQELELTGIRRGASPGATITTYDASCHLLHGQRAGDASLGMLRAIPALEFAPLTESETCCGGAGVYNLLEAELSTRVLREKLSHLQATKAALVATGNPGCHMQIGAGAYLAGLSLHACHPVELLDESYRRAGVYEAVASDE
ncbi:MAG TPA: heterodisulfide reductase-related iron-sulfur binding cluster [Pyrinomonadaceae bacterium]|jgi:glycolate oxidase iron-sulfur subunit